MYGERSIKHASSTEIRKSEEDTLFKVKSVVGEVEREMRKKKQSSPG